MANEKREMENDPYLADLGGLAVSRSAKRCSLQETNDAETVHV